MTGENTMTLQLVKPQQKYLPDVYKAVAEYKSAPSEYTILAVQKMIEAAENDFTTYFINTENESLGVNLKPGYVAHTIYWLVDSDKYIGTFDLRHSLTPYLENIGGHIAYQIRPSAQRKGYACKGLKLCLELARKKGIERALITCKEHNVGSYAVMRKTMLEMGGTEISPFTEEGVVNKRIWINTQKNKEI